MDLELKKFYEYRNKASNMKIAVIGDIMVDHYVIGKVSRISPEAPVPVLENLQDEYRLGGAANVALNISKLEAETYLFGVVGDDKNADLLIELLNDNKIDSSFIVRDKNRPTTIKTRITAKTQQIVRVDREVTTLVSPAIEHTIINNFKEIVGDIDAVILEDYNKGVLTKRVITEIIRLSRENNVVVTVDPKVENFFAYKDVTLFKPNLHELAKNMNKKIKDDHDISEIAWSLFKNIEPEYLIVTLGSKGMLIFEKGKNIYSLPTYAKEVFDVSGAGDTVISIVTIILAMKGTILEAAMIGNSAAGVVCGKKGTATTTWDEITYFVELESK